MPLLARVTNWQIMDQKCRESRCQLFRWVSFLFAIFCTSAPPACSPWHCLGFIANWGGHGLCCRENCPSFMYFWQIAALPACFAFIPNCCPQKICQSIRRQVGSTLFKSRLVHFLPKMPTLHGATLAVKSKHRQTYFRIKILLFRQFLIFLKQIVPLNCQHKRERIALPRCLGFV